MVGRSGPLSTTDRPEQASLWRWDRPQIGYLANFSSERARGFDRLSRSAALAAGRNSRPRTPAAAPPAASGAGRFVDLASARRAGAGNPHHRCVPADRAHRGRALLSGLPAWRSTVGCVRLRALCPGVPGLWQSFRPRKLETRACQPMTGASARLPVAVTR